MYRTSDEKSFSSFFRGNKSSTLNNLSGFPPFFPHPLSAMGKKEIKRLMAHFSQSDSMDVT